MAALYSAGSVGVDVVPVTDKFFAELRAKMARVRDLTVGVDFEPNTLAYDRESGRINGRTLTNTVKIEGDASGIQRIRRAIEDERKQFENMTFSVPRFDTKDAARQIDKFVDDVDKKIATVSKNGKGIDFAGYTDRSLAHVHENLQRIADLEAERRKVNEQYEDARAREDDKAQKSAAARIKSIDDEIHQLNAKKDTYIHTLSEIRRAQDEYAKYVDEFNKRIRGIAVTQPYETLFQKAKLREQTQEYKDASAELTKARDEYVKRVSELVSGRKWVNGSDLNYDPLKYLDYDTKFVKDLNDSLKQLEQQEKAVAKANKLSDLNKDFATWRDSMSDTARNTNSARKEMSDYRSEAKKATDLLDDQEKELVKLQRAMAKFKPYGTSRELNKEINDFLTDLRRVRREVQRNPIKAKVTLDDGLFRERFADLIYDANDVLEKLDKQHTIDIRFSHWEDDAERLEDRLDRLTHQRVDIPVEWQVDQQRIISRMREIAEEIKRNPDRAVELEANLDLDMKRAEERLKDFEKEHDKLDMDLDLQTRLAQTHLAWFTRPRTVDIYANFKSTDLGKIVNGMTSGATGINYVNNQFQKLVNLMDSLDTVIPKWSLLGATVLSLGAGFTNLAGTIGGIGESLVSMSAAALAAPAALGGLTAAFVAGRWAFQDAQEKFDATTTSLNGLKDAVGDAAWNEYGDQLYQLANDIAPTLKEGLTGIATSEGRVAANLMRIVGQNEKTSELARIFANTSVAVDDLDPGLQSLTRSLLTLGDETSQYLPRMSTYVSNLAAQFAAWVDEAQRTGEITASLDRAIEQGGYLVDIFGSLKGILSGTFGTFAQYENGLQGFSEAIESANRAVNSIKFQDVLNELIAGAQTAQDTVRDSFSGIGDDLWSLRGEMRNAFEDAGTIVASVLSNVSEMLADSGDGIRDFTDGLASGWSKAMDAVGDSGPVFSDLLSMVGQLSDTFGGTFAAGLRTIGPLMSGIANTTEAVAEAFDSLPEPLKQAIALYATFGRAGKTALDTVKTSMLQNIMQTAQYQRSMSDLGLTLTNTDMSFRNIAKSWMSVQGIDLGGAFSNADSKLKSMNSSMSATAKSAGSFSQAFSSLKGVLSGVGWTVGITAVVTAISDFISRSEATKQASEDIGDAMSDMSSMATNAANGIDLVADSIRDSFDAGDFGESGLNWLSDWRTGFDNVSDAAEVTGISVDSMIDAITGGTSAYKGMQSQLDQLIASNTTFTGSQSGSIQVMNEIAKAAQKQSGALTDAYNAYRDQVEQLAVSNGYTIEYADSLLDAGEDATSLAIALGSAEDRTKMLSEAQRIATDIADQQREAQQNLLDVSSRYGEVYSGIGDDINRVNNLASQGQRVWDETAQGIEGVAGSFDIMTQAGREAQSSLDDLGTSGHDLLEAMVDAGSSTDDVKAKQAELAQQFHDTAVAMGVPEAAAQELQRVYGLTPEEVDTLFTAKTDESRQALTEYLSNLRALYPGEGNTATFTTVLNGVNTGALTSTQEVSEALDELTTNSDKYTIVLSADNQQVMTSVDFAEQYCQKNAEGEYTSTLNAVDLASVTVGEVAQAIMNVPTVWDSYVTSIVEGKSETDALNDAIRNVPVLWDAYQKAHTSGKSDVDALRDAIMSIPGARDVYQKAITSGKSDVDALRSSIASLRDRTVTITVNNVRGRWDDTGTAVLQKGRYATGGRINGPGTGTSDSIPAWLSNGEYVLKASTVKKLDSQYGIGFLDYLNRMGKFPTSRVNAMPASIRSSYAYANGGRVNTDRVNVQVAPVVNVRVGRESGNVNQVFNVSTNNPEKFTRIVGEKLSNVIA